MNSNKIYYRIKNDENLQFEKIKNWSIIDF